MQSMGYGAGFNLNDDTEWENAAATSPFATFTYTYNIGDTIREGILFLLQDNLAKIGIKVLDAGTSYAEFIYMLYEIGGYNRNMLQLFHLPSEPYINDPSSVFDWYLSNTSVYNFAQVNDWETSEWMQDALIETNPIQREILYDKIQKRLVEEVYPWVWCSVPKLTTAYHEDLTGFQQNALERLYFYPCKWVRGNPGPFVLSSDAESPDTDGNFNLAWTVSDGAINYIVYQHDNYIAEINGSLTPLAVETTRLTLPSIIDSNGTYYFIIVAHNEIGDTLSNCISVVVSIPPPGSFIMASNADALDIDGIFDLLWSSASNADNYSVYQYNDFITIINGSLTLLAGEITGFTIPLSSYTSGKYYFIVVAHNKNGDTLSNCISVNILIPDTLTITAPDNSTSWEPGTSQYINWTSTGSISNIKIDLYNNDLFVVEITPSTINDGEFYWTIPSEFVDSNQYQIRINHVSNPSAYVYSDYFEIKTPASAPPGILGYNFYILIGIICVISVIFVKNRIKNYAYYD